MKLVQSVGIQVFMFSFCFYIFACGEASEADKKTMGSPISEQLVWEKVQLKRAVGNCADTTGTQPCAEVEFEWDTITSGPASANISAANDTISKYLISTISYDPDAPVITELSTALDTFFAEYLEYNQAGSEFLTRNFLNTKTSVLRNDKAVATLQLTSDSYMGGAHPNYFVQFINLDPQTGKILSASDYILDRNSLMQIAQVAFRKAREISDNEILEDAGYFVGMDGFTLPDNMGFNEEGLLLFYNPYEVASYAQGPTEFTIPYSELVGVVREEFLFQ